MDKKIPIEAAQKIISRQRSEHVTVGESKGPHLGLHGDDVHIPRLKQKLYM